MKAARIVWNIVLLTIAAAMMRRIVPNIVAQMTHRPPTKSKDLLFEWMWVSVEGCALLLSILLILTSLGTWAWRPVARPVRWVYGIVGVVFLLGAVVPTVRELRDHGFVLWGDRICFLVSYLFFATPIIVCGLGYPVVLARFLAGRRRSSLDEHPR